MVFIKKCERKLIQCVTDITKPMKKLLERGTVIAKFEHFYKVMRRTLYITLYCKFQFSKANIKQT